MKIKPFLPVVGLTVAAFLLVPACSTVSSRIKDNQTYFNSLSPSDQTLVRKGQIKVGLDQKAVLIALGNPARITHKIEGKKKFEIWTYTRNRAEQVPNWSYTYVRDRHDRLCAVRSYDPVTVWTTETALKVTFKNGKVFSAEEF